jgi:hypothetical protein
MSQVASADATAFGVTTTAENLESAKEFYKKFYPDFVSMTEGVFGTIKYFSLLGKDGEVLVNVLQKQADNPIRGAIPMLKVNSVAEFGKKLKSMGGKEIIPQMVCPCTHAYFSVMTDAFGNQVMIKEPKEHQVKS